MSKERNKAVPAVYLVLKKENKILLMRRAGSAYYENWYSLPAGHIEEGELPIDAFIREVYEEIGIKINKEDVQLIHTMYRTKKDETGDRVDLFFTASKYQNEPKICEPGKCDDLQWFPINNLPEKVVPYIRDVIRDINDKINYSEIL